MHLDMQGRYYTKENQCQRHLYFLLPPNAMLDANIAFFISPIVKSSFDLFKSFQKKQCSHLALHLVVTKNISASGIDFLLYNIFLAYLNASLIPSLLLF